MTIAAQIGVFLTADDATYLADVLDHVCATMRPSARVAFLIKRMRDSCDALTPTQGNTHAAVTSGMGVGDYRAYDLVDVAEAAQLLGCSSANVRDLVRRGKLPAHRSAGRWVLPARSVLERVQRQEARRSH